MLLSQWAKNKTFRRRVENYSIIFKIFVFIFILKNGDRRNENNNDNYDVPTALGLRGDGSIPSFFTNVTPSNLPDR